MSGLFDGLLLYHKVNRAAAQEPSHRLIIWPAAAALFYYWRLSTNLASNGQQVPKQSKC